MKRAHAKVRDALTALTGEAPPTSAEALFDGVRQLDAGDVLLRAGVVPTTAAFVVEGLFRLFYRRADGRELNKAFVAQGDFCGALEALLEGSPSRLTIEALEQSVVLVVPYARLVALYDREPYWERFGRRLTERLYLKKAKREAELLMDSAGARYETFLAEHGAIEQRVPDYHVASYLGVKPETLSRLKRARTRRG